MKKVVLLCICILFIFAGCEKDDGYIRTETLVIASERIVNPGQHDLAQAYHLAKRSVTGGEWESIPGYINGLDYEPGYEYVVRVNILEIKNPKIDESGTQVVLVKVLSKIRKDSENLPPNDVYTDNT